MKNIHVFSCFVTVLFMVSTFIGNAQGFFDQLQNQTLSSWSGFDFSGVARDLVPSFTEENAQLEQTIRTIVLQLRNGTAIQIPGVVIADPMTMGDFNTTVKQGSTNAEVQLRNVSISGISQVAVDEASANLAKLQVGIGLNITKLSTTGQYDLRGKYSFFRINGAGDFSLNITDAYVTGQMYLTVNEAGMLEVSNIDLDMTVEDIELWFDNLFGIMSSFSNIILNAISPIIFNNIKPTLLSEMKQVITSMVNDELANLPIQPEFNQTQIPLDLAIANTATQIRSMNLDPFPLPSLEFQFNKKFLFIRVYGNLSVDEGYFKGLSSIHRTGEIELSYKDNSGNVTAEIGFGDLTGGCKWTANVMGIGRSGGAHFTIKQIHALVTITQENEQFSHPIVDRLRIAQIERMALDMDGLGTFDYLLEFFTNFFTNAFKKQFAKILEMQVKEILQQNLQQFKIPF